MAEVLKKLQALRLEEAVGIFEFGCDETLSYYAVPVAHLCHIRTSNPLLRLNRELRHQPRVVGSFPDMHTTLMLVPTRPCGIACQKWGTQWYMNMKQEVFA